MAAEVLLSNQVELHELHCGSMCPDWLYSFEGVLPLYIWLSTFLLCKIPELRKKISYSFLLGLYCFVHFPQLSGFLLYLSANILALTVWAAPDLVLFAASFDM